MNLKNKLLKIIKSKFFIIICIILILLITYICLEDNFFEMNNHENAWNEENTVSEKEEENVFWQEGSLKNEEIVENLEESLEEKEIPKDELEVINNEKIYVYITGEVNNPGIVVLPIGSRISDAIDYAGGVTSNADIMKINLVYMLQDGMKVNIPSSKELNDNPNFEYITMGSGDEKNDNKDFKALETTNNKSESAFKISNVNINTATQTELETLPGIGPSLALKIINYRKENEELENTKKEIEEIGVQVLAVKGDVANFEECENFVKQVIERFGQIDVLVNNAGITKDMLLMRMKKEDFEQVIDTNLVGTFNVTKNVVPYMMKARSGRIINISSVVGISGNAGQTNYSASKAGIIGFTKSLAKEIASRNILVNAVAPGFIETNMTDVLKDDVKQEIAKNIPLKRMGTAQDVANVVKFLASDDSSYITGQVINVDGGMLM